MHVLFAVTQLVANEALDTDDSPEIAGGYVVEVKDGSNDPTEKALDTFHETIEARHCTGPSYAAISHSPQRYAQQPLKTI